MPDLGQPFKNTPLALHPWTPRASDHDTINLAKEKYCLGG